MIYLASERHFIDHLAPIHAQTGGEFVVPPELVSHARRCGITPIALSERESRSYIARGRGAVVIAAIGDYKTVKGSRRPIALVNHGNGQSFTQPHPSYSGGNGRDGIALFIEPNERAAGLTRRANPEAIVTVCGSPKLDAWHNREPKRRGRKPVIAFGFHWENILWPETRSAWPYYKRHLPEVAKRWTVLGHGHPRIWPLLEKRYPKLGIEPVRDFGEVLERADVYVCDCSSTLYEFASLDRPVVVLNAPFYRREVEHGLRFWEYADVGPQVDYPEQLIPAIEQALADSPQQQARRREIAAAVYPYRGDAARRAAMAVVNLEAEAPEVEMSVALNYTKRRADGLWEIYGAVNGIAVTEIADLGDNPTIQECVAVLREPPKVERVLTEPDPPREPVDGLDTLKIADLRNLAMSEGIEIPADIRLKADLVAFLDEALERAE